MDYQQNRSSGSYGYPALPGQTEIPQCDHVRVIENKNSGFKTNIVLALVSALVFMRFKPHDAPQPRQNRVLAQYCQYTCTYVYCKPAGPGNEHHETKGAQNIKEKDM
jgi:hypothetical protein